MPPGHCLNQLRLESVPGRHETCNVVVMRCYVFGRPFVPFVKRFALSYRSVVCPVCLSVTLVYCGQTVGWIKMKLGKQVGLGPGHIALGGDPALPPLKGHIPPIVGPYLLRPNGCMDQDVT